MGTECKVWSPFPDLRVRATSLGEGRYHLETWVRKQEGWFYVLQSVPQIMMLAEHPPLGVD